MSRYGYFVSSRLRIISYIYKELSLRFNCRLSCFQCDNNIVVGTTSVLFRSYLSNAIVRIYVSFKYMEVIFLKQKQNHDNDIYCVTNHITTR
jgi:hypothetical protein